MRPFEEMWGISSRFCGRYHETEALMLYEEVSRLEYPEVVEVGSLCGRSASLLGLICEDNGGRLTCVDAFYEDPHLGTRGAHSLLVNMRLVARVEFELMAMRSVSAAALFTRRIDVLHVDGSHKEDDVRLDCDVWLPKLRKDGLAFFHDYNQNQVRRVVRNATKVGFEDLGQTERLKLFRRDR